MNWHSKAPALSMSDLNNPVEKTGASESVLLVAILWAAAMALAAYRLSNS